MAWIAVSRLDASRSLEAERRSMTGPMQISSRGQVWSPVDRRMGATRRHADEAEATRRSAATRCSAIVSRRRQRSASERWFDRMRQCESPVASWRDVASGWLLMVAVIAALLASPPLRLPHRDYRVQASSELVCAATCSGVSPTGSPIASP